MQHYDFFIAGRWRNYHEIQKVLDIVRTSGKTAYCFIENLYEGEKIEFSQSNDIECIMRKLESLDMSDDFLDKIFATDMAAERNSDNFLLVLPAGISGHVEAGAAYGLGKKCYAVGTPEKTETLYKIFDTIFPDNAALEQWLKNP